MLIHEIFGLALVRNDEKNMVYLHQQNLNIGNIFFHKHENKRNRRHHKNYIKEINITLQGIYFKIKTFHNISYNPTLEIFFGNLLISYIYIKYKIFKVKSLSLYLKILINSFLSCTYQNHQTFHI